MAETLKTSDYIVAFIDILGSKQRIKDDCDGSLNVVHNVYEKSLALFGDLFKERVKFHVSIFSDNIVIATKVENEKLLQWYFQTTHFMAAILQGNFLFNNLLVRGAITRGSFYCDDLMVWGKALVQAYTLESSVAFYPRIIVDPNLIGEMGLTVQKNDEHYWLIQDVDGMFYLDYLQAKYIKNFRHMILSELERYDDRIIKALDMPNVAQKVIWHLEYIKKKAAEVL